MDKVIVITGGGRGIGAATALLLHNRVLGTLNVDHKLLGRQRLPQ